jgi:hypothetical protein
MVRMEVKLLFRATRENWQGAGKARPRRQPQWVRVRRLFPQPEAVLAAGRGPTKREPLVGDG